MPSIGTITVNDGKATPLSHVFTPIGKPLGSDFETWVNQAQSRPSLREELRIKVQQPTKKDQPFRISTVLIQPVVKVVDGVDTLDFQNRVDQTFTLSGVGTLASRKDLRVMLANIDLNALVLAAIDGPETFW